MAYSEEERREVSEKQAFNGGLSWKNSKSWLVRLMRDDNLPEVIGEAFESWEAAAKAGAQYCGELPPYRYRIEQDDPD